MSAALTLLCQMARADSAFVVVTPSGGEAWEAGVRRRITWSGPTGGNVRIELSRDGGLTFEPLFSNTPNDGVHEWEVEEPLTTTGRVRITSLENQTVTGMSAADFSIVDAVVGLIVTQPKAGDTWLVGSAQHIKWNAAAGGDVRIERTCDGGAAFETIAAETPNDGDEPWIVRGPVAQCRLRITHLDDATLVGESEEFTIGEALGFRLNAPSGGEVWASGTRHLILWDSPRGGRVRVDVSRDGGLTFRTLFADTANDGAVEWEVDEPASVRCRIRLTLLADPSVVAVSANDFAVVDEVVGLTVVQPEAASVWVVGTQQLIKWNAPPEGTVRIELTRDDGTTFETLFDTTLNDGQEFWTVTGPIGRAGVRITRVEDPAVAADSAEFAITRVDGVLVTAPRGGELWTIGSRQFIRWQGIEGGRVTVELSRDGGAIWEPLFTNRLDRENGSLAWVVEGPPSEECLVRVTRTTAPFVSDASDEPFGITIAPLTVTAPAEGDELVIGTQRLITWSGLGFGQVGIDLSRDGGSTWETLFARTPNDGAQYWTVSGPPTADALVRVVGLDDLPGVDVGDGAFVISPGSIALVQPNGGERWRVGSPQLLTWATTTGGSVRAEISRDGGAWEPLFLNTPNDGRELWTVSGPPCTECWLRLVSLPAEELEDQSDAPFSIFCTPTPVAIAAGEEKTGTLQPGQCEAPHRPGSRGQLYSFTMPAAGRVAVDLASDDFQPYLLLLGADGQMIAQGGGGPTGDTRLEVELASGGPYTIEVTSAESGAAGAYRLSLVRFDVTLLSPRAGEVWKLGDLRSITWRSGAPGALVDILLFRDGDPNGAGESLFMTTPNDGEQTWKVTGPPSAAAVVQVCVPDGSTGRRSCATSAAFALQTCVPTEARTCYSGSARTQGVGACRAGHLQCLSGAFQGCTGEVLPTREVCGDGIDQDCDGADELCKPCAEQGSCIDDDSCTADSCVQGECQHDRPVGWALLDCRRDVLRLTLSTVDASCQAARPNLSRRHRRKLSRVLAVVENAVARARTAANKPRCVKQLERARRMTERLQFELDQANGRGSVCDQSPLLTRRIGELAAAVVGVSSCTP